MGYPRPLQERVPILVGGSGERQTLRLVARYADACNLQGGPDVVRKKLDVLAAHCAAADRPIEDIEVTHLSVALAARDPQALAATVERLRPPAVSPEAFAARTNAATVDDHIGRFRQLAEAGVDTAIVALPDLTDDGALECFGEVIKAFT
jgi:alkanesulfonate monooxygenase SsuD/methylene tetrahydromethanopterin reductase-like flavin-dependent oxidoreductase (luciferase family)